MLKKILFSILFLVILSSTGGCYLIGHWNDSSPSSISTNSSSVSPGSYIVAFDSQGATVGASPDWIMVTPPATTVGRLPTAPAKTGYYFGGWYTATNGGGTQFTASTPVTADIMVYALWNNYGSYIVAFDSQGGTGRAQPV